MNNIFIYVTDIRGFDLALYSAMSVALSQGSHCNICIYCHKFMPAQAAMLTHAFARVGTNLLFHDISAPELEDRPMPPHIKKTALYKLYAVDKALEEFEVVTYLDNDILVFGKLDIKDIECEDKSMAAVVDMDLSETGVLRRLNGRVATAGGQQFHYFNSGVMFFFKKNWNGSHFLTKYREALDIHDIKCKYKISCALTDQCALNMTFEGMWHRLSCTYNMQASAKFTSFWQSAAVRHYCGPRKFLPISLFRSDRRDIQHITNVRNALGLPPGRYLYIAFDILYKLNYLRNYHRSHSIKRLLEFIC
jgi:lipopolysaccharide biosynthesis glycosyltransferase